MATESIRRIYTERRSMHSCKILDGLIIVLINCINKYSLNSINNKGKGNNTKYYTFGWCNIPQS